MKELLAIDIGNTNVKYGYFVDGKLTEYRSHRVNETPYAASANLSTTTCPVAISSVVPEAEKTLRKVLGTLMPDRKIISISASKQNLLTGMDQTMGADRVADAIAAWKIYGKNGKNGKNGRYRRPVVVFGLGTATTMLVISASGHVLGGFIAPGLNMTLVSLHDHTALLPLLTMQGQRGELRQLGYDTNTHILNGVFSGHIGLIREWLAIAKEQLGEKPLAVATGGFSGTPRMINTNKKFKLFNTIDPELTLKGIYLLASSQNQTL